MSRTTFRPVSLAILLCVIVPAAASAQAPLPVQPAQPSGFERTLSDQLAESVNEPGLQNTLNVYWTRPLSRSNDPLLTDHVFHWDWSAC